MQHSLAVNKGQRFSNTPLSFLILNLLPWDTCSLKHIIMRGSMSNRVTAYLESWPTGGNPKGISPEQCFIFMKKKHPTLIYLWWYSIDPWRRYPPHIPSFSERSEVMVIYKVVLKIEEIQYPVKDTSPGAYCLKALKEDLQADKTDISVFHS